MPTTQRPRESASRPSNAGGSRKQLEEAETRIEMLVRKGDKAQPEPFRPDKA
jgi:hypothetical protein